MQDDAYANLRSKEKAKGGTGAQKTDLKGRPVR